MTTRRPASGTTEERIYKWWWGGSLHGESGRPVPDETAWLEMNIVYDMHQSMGHSEAEIHELGKRHRDIYYGYGVVQLRQWVAMMKAPGKRKVENRELRR